MHPKVMAVTGYKSFELTIQSENDPRIAIIKQALKRHIIEFIEAGGEWIISSGQLGVEMWASQVVNELKEDYNIQYGVFPPFENQESRWPDTTKEAYQTLIERADHYQPVYKGDYKGPHQFTKKNQFLVSKSQVSLILIDEDFPGSVSYYFNEVESHQKSNEYELRTITPLDLEDIAREWEENQSTF
ncbi:Uncharacterized SPBc2 prophage-derived protein YoqJ [Pelagirhabdus alkalitolerans]|uniref:Uncharacterized SPBc2 prophage-derived protein YoqJ n=1 Tax=Pelagirhabdus alkalitolerans TaxID=1612202 RepID=A0A1G6H9R5_9BACI|nr:SLOG family protein [Pelagirhabdus alkalitolerans]SDB90951.1 Uncharacterized SPBc2 prophage-derived protein YoqJ [Pelagirhabdus alkalitolerans]